MIWSCYSKALVEKFAIVNWALWNRKNAKIHEREINEDKFLIESSLSLLVEFQSLKNYSLTPKIPCRWKPPPQNWLKINVDRVVSRRQGNESIGLVIRDWRGGVQMAKTCPVQNVRRFGIVPKS